LPGNISPPEVNRKQFPKHPAIHTPFAGTGGTNTIALNENAHPSQQGSPVHDDSSRRESCLQLSYANPFATGGYPLLYGVKILLIDLLWHGTSFLSRKEFCDSITTYSSRKSIFETKNWH